ncbi:hypothetical protein MAR_016025 [Mya arenaria]|uniref:Uncharacterized protein n=1 Tax=Mya arenaria TaxID=6604 RepID=A0ABY7FM97_MYAAR|nr:hypothetical protein MAR_016025 [Mya arenaria]
MPKPEEWGWDLTGNNYTPVKCALPPAPANLLNVILIAITKKYLQETWHGMFSKLWIRSWCWMIQFSKL